MMRIIFILIFICISTVVLAQSPKQQVLEDRKWFGYGDCRTPRNEPRILDLPGDILIRDTIDKKIGGIITARHVALGDMQKEESQKDNKLPQITIDDINTKRKLLATLRTWANTLPEDRSKKAYLCVIQMYNKELDGAHDELLTSNLEASMKKPVTVPLPP
jgi:hypothetical protein